MSHSTNVPRGRLLLYLDILGFREMTRDGSAAEVYEKLNQCLQAVRNVERNVARFQSIYFSDTILLYQETTGFRLDRFFDLCFAANTVFATLLSSDIPVSGAIAFGPFTVKTERAGSHRVYFGSPLVEAYDTEKNEKWLGVVACPSVADRLTDVRVKAHQDAGAWRRRTDGAHTTLMLNPFEPIARHFSHMRSTGKEPNPNHLELRMPLKALAFIARSAAGLEAKGNFTSSVSSRYQNTLGFARAVLPDGAFEWALSAVDELKPYKTLLAQLFPRKNP